MSKKGATFFMSGNGSHFHFPKDVALQSATYTFPHELIMSFGLERGNAIRLIHKYNTAFK